VGAAFGHAAYEAPGAENVFEALARLQTLSWMQRPIVVRSWVAAALKANGGVRFGDAAADALRLTCTLLDSPMPPELARTTSPFPPTNGRATGHAECRQELARPRPWSTEP
jgi:hypothetical protein